MNKQHKFNWILPSQFANCRWLCLLVFSMLQCSLVWADDLTINNLEFSTLSASQVQLQMDMSGPVAEPKIFQTDNPARIALDFNGVKSNLAKKSFPVNQGAASTVYVVEAGERTRVVINLTERVPYQTRIDGNKFFILLNGGSLSKSATVTSASELPVVRDAAINKFLPEQTIKSIDFRRGPNGEGRILLGLTNPNTVVDSKESGGKVVLNFINTHLPDSLMKSFDVSDFATPVQKIDAVGKGSGVNLVITPGNPNYEYSSFQSDNLLTVEFRPLTVAEKEAKLKEKFPFIGNKLSLNFQDIEVRSVLQILADFTDLNIVAADTVAGNVTLRLNDVPWDQALELILKSKGLSKRQSGNVIMVAPSVEIQKMEEEELKAQNASEQLEPLKTENIQINYAKAVDICNVLMGRGNFVASGPGNKRVTSSDGGDIADSSSGSAAGSQGCGSNSGSSSGGMTSGVQSGNSSAANGTQSDQFRVISSRGAVIVDARTNTLIIKDTSKQLEEAHKMIEKLDIPVRQVSIEARIVIANTGFSEELGVKFGVAKHAPNIGSGKSFSVGGTPSDNRASTLDTSAVLVDLGAKFMDAYPPAALGMTLARTADYILNLELQAMQNDFGGEILANPRLVTSDRVQARIKQGVELPFQASSGNQGNTISYKEAVLELNVTPQITPEGSIIMDLIVKKDDKSAEQVGPGFGIDQRRIQTLVRVNDGETVVLGGVYESTSFRNKDKVPFFSDIPGLGWLFNRNYENETKRELLIFVTPRVIKDSLSVN